MEADFAKKGYRLPAARKTGTTIAGVVYKREEGQYIRAEPGNSPDIQWYQGYIGAALVLGGVDVTGPHLYSIYPHGSTDKLPYVTMGSGSLAAMAVFEDKFRPDMEVSYAALLFVGMLFGTRNRVCREDRRCFNVECFLGHAAFCVTVSQNDDPHPQCFLTENRGTVYVLHVTQTWSENGAA
ncbi:hypothetical protein GH733_011248 [Mirounga leonina]|nr:hypothetical protein GH733_011248 [Mirounga leonina]